MALQFQGKRLKEPVVAGQESRMEAERIHSSKKRSRSERDVPEGSSKGVGGLLPWQNASSRIVRVSRVSGGKDRHSKVLTVKGLRDRRVRLSVSTSIQFYDLQDRLGYDRPSKAVDWLIKAAAAAIVNLPELEGPFPGPPSTAIPSRDILLKRSTVGEHDISQSKSTCSSASETSKSSVLSLSNCWSVIKENEYFRNHNKESSLCEFLAPGDNCTGGDAADGFVTLGTGFDHKQLKPLPASTTSNFFRQTGMFPQLEPSFYSLLHYGSSPNVGTGGMAYSATAPGEHQDIHQLSFMQDHAIPVTMLATRGDPNPNVSISSGIAGFTRGTLQSNSPNQHQLVPGANLPFFRSATIPITTAAGSFLENQFFGDFNGRLQLFCNDVERHPELKRERKG